MSASKHAIRIALVWLVPVVLVFSGPACALPWILSSILTIVELPGFRKKLFGSRARKHLPCLKVPVLMRLAVLWMVQVWWVILVSRAAGSPEEQTIDISGITDPQKAADPAVRQGQAGDAGMLKTMSVVLPCAGEGDYAFKTVRSVFETTPAEVLKEIIVVDDGSDPPLSRSVITEEVQQKYGVRLLRHESTVGLIGSKKDGGAAAVGDIIVFFDCHVAPQPRWYKKFLSLINENYRRIVVPVITDLDVGSWRQRSASHSVSKCYLTWDADFKWYNSNDDYVPILSGGLLGMSRRWWNETGGYDEQMRSWGGENLDQSLRTWLCGGEIVIARGSFVAHMWRKPSDKRTVAHYKVDGMAAAKNRLRAAVAWYGDFAEKLGDFPALMAGRTEADGSPWFGDITNILSVKERLKCHSFAWFLQRFSDVYIDAGLVPSEIFRLRVANSTKCLTYRGVAGTSPDGKGTATLEECDPESSRQFWHLGNRDKLKEGMACCSGLRAWNTDQCLSKAPSSWSSGHMATYVCDISGATSNQAWSLTPDGKLGLRTTSGFLKASCLEASGDGVSVHTAACEAGAWVKDGAMEPLEHQIFVKAQSEEASGEDSS